MTPGYFKTAAVAVALAGLPLLATAQTPPPVPPSHTTGIYVGVGGGITDANLESTSWAPPAGTAWTSDNTSGAVKGFVGWRFNKYLGIEGGYYYLGKIENQYQGPGGYGSTSSTLDGWVLEAVGYLPLNEYFSVIGKLGAINAMIDTSLYGATPSGLLPVSTSKVNFTWGLGAQLDLDQRWALRAEYENLGKFGDSNTGEMRVELWSGSALLKF
jgi:opacity protein-like surface antigen